MRMFGVSLGSGSSGGTVTDVTATSPLASSGGTTPDISIGNAAADGTTKGAASFAAADFNASSGNISLDYTNGQMASGTTPGYMSGTTQNFSGAKTFNTAPHIFTISTGVTAPEQQVSLQGSLPNATATVQSFLSITSDGAGGFASLGNTSSSGFYRYGLRSRFTGTLSHATSAAYGIYWDVRGAYAGASPSNEEGLYGIRVFSNNTNNAGYNSGVSSLASAGNKVFAGTFQATGASGSSPMNIGVAGKASQVTGAQSTAVYGKLYATNDGTNLTDALPNASAAGLFDNGNTTGDIINLQDASTEVFKIADGGVMHWGTTEAATGAVALTLLNGPTAASGNPAKYFVVVDGGTSYVIPAWAI